MMKVKTLNYRLAEQYNAGKITLRQAAEQFYLHGWTNYSKLKVNNIVEITEYDGTKRNCIVLPVTRKDINHGVNASIPGLYGFRGLWYKGNGTKRMSYGKIYDLAFYDCRVIRNNIKGLSKKQLQEILK